MSIIYTQNDEAVKSAYKISKIDLSDAETCEFAYCDKTFKMFWKFDDNDYQVMTNGEDELEYAKSVKNLKEAIDLISMKDAIVIEHFLNMFFELEVDVKIQFVQDDNVYHLYQGGENFESVYVEFFEKHFKVIEK